MQKRVVYVEHVLEAKMSYSVNQVVEFIENDWEIGGEIVCAGSDDEFDCEEEECNGEEMLVEDTEERDYDERIEEMEYGQDEM